MIKIDEVLRSPEENKLFRRAGMEPRRISEKLLRPGSLGYMSPDDEIEYMERLLIEDKYRFCRYQTYKIYHCLATFYNVYLLKFVAEFVENERGEFIFTDSKIIEIYYQHSKVRRPQSPVKRRDPNLEDGSLPSPHKASQKSLAPGTLNFQGDYSEASQRRTLDDGNGDSLFRS